MMMNVTMSRPICNCEALHLMFVCGAYNSQFS